LTSVVPDNYTDEKTFLDDLQRNPRLQPYEFWGLMASLTVIVQHFASVAIFCCAFVVIFQERVSPVSIVGWASFGSFLAWVLWDYWMGQEETAAARRVQNSTLSREEKDGTTRSRVTSATFSDVAASDAPKATAAPSDPSPYEKPSSYIDPASSLSPRNWQRLATVKSAILIYAALLGLSPILKSLTRSTTSDSIWAFTTGLLFMNVAFFDYSSGTGAQYVCRNLGGILLLTRSIVFQPPSRPIPPSWPPLCLHRDYRRLRTSSHCPCSPSRSSVSSPFSVASFAPNPRQATLH
jgi:phosphatidylinositol glycan class C protein